MVVIPEGASGRQESPFGEAAVGIHERRPSQKLELVISEDNSKDHHDEYAARIAKSGARLDLAFPVKSRAHQETI